MRNKTICAVALAAGLSTRMGSDKLLASYRGRPMAEHLFSRLWENRRLFLRVLVVGRSQGIQELARRFGFDYVHNPEPERGMGRSLALGIAAAPLCDGYLLALADMPDLKAGTLHLLCQAFCGQPGRIAVPLCGGRRGNPVVFPAHFREELLALEGDSGGRAIIRREEKALCRVQVYDPGVLRDIDTREELLRAGGP